MAGIQLVDGGAPTRGRVAIQMGGKWGKVCAGQFGAEEAAVVCRELGFSGGVATTRFPVGAPPYLIGRVFCTGSEARLADCKWVTTSTCPPGKAAGVVCSREFAVACCTH